MVVITGAGRGLGLELVKLHAEAGDSVLAVTHTITDELKNVEGNIKIVTCELTDEADVRRVFADFSGPLHILYNVAGLYYEDQREQLDLNKCKRMYDVNALAPLLVMTCLKPFITNNTVIINVSSEAGSIGECGRASEYGYCMSKAAFNMASKIFQNETGVRMLVYHPGWLRTQMGGERAAASEYSISARQSAEVLVNMNVEQGITFLDYTGKHWEW